MKNKYICIPKSLFNTDLSCEAILLYGLICDRMKLSNKNRHSFTDCDGRVYVYYTLESICEKLTIGKNKATRLFKELEKRNLIKRKRGGCGKPAAIYLTDESAENELYRNPENGLDMLRNEDYRLPENKNSDSSKESGNNNKINKTELNKTESFIPDVTAIEREVMEQIEYDYLVSRKYGDVLDELVCIMIEEMCCISPTAKIAGKEFGRDMVIKRLKQINSLHMEYIMERLKDTTSEISNIRAYLLAVLFNAPTTMNSFYDAEYRRDFS